MFLLNDLLEYFNMTKDKLRERASPDALAALKTAATAFFGDLEVPDPSRAAVSEGIDNFAQEIFGVHEAAKIHTVLSNVWDRTADERFLTRVIMYDAGSLALRSLMRVDVVNGVYLDLSGETVQGKYIGSVTGYMTTAETRALALDYHIAASQA